MRIPCSKCDFLEYGPSGQELESFGGGTLVHTSSAMAFDEALDELLVYGSDDPNYARNGEEGPNGEHLHEDVEYGHDGVWAFPAPSPGPLVESGSEKAIRNRVVPGRLKRS